MSTADPARLAAEGYDRIAEQYAALGERSGWGALPEYLHVLTQALPPRSRVLDLGCGAGTPVASSLARNHDVVAVDISPVQLGLVRRSAPAVAPVRADLAGVAFAAASFDAVVCCYSLTHVPRERHLQTLARVAGWLVPGGLALLAMGAGDHPDAVAEDFLGLGVPMFVSHYDAATNRRLVEQAGLRVLRADVREQREDDRSVRFCWLVAERPR